MTRYWNKLVDYGYDCRWPVNGARRSSVDMTKVIRDCENR